MDRELRVKRVGRQAPAPLTRLELDSAYRKGHISSANMLLIDIVNEIYGGPQAKEVIRKLAGGQKKTEKGSNRNGSKPD